MSAEKPTCRSTRTINFGEQLGPRGGRYPGDWPLMLMKIGCGQERDHFGPHVFSLAVYNRDDKLLYEITVKWEDP